MIKKIVFVVISVVFIAWFVAFIKVNYIQHEYASVTQQQLEQAKQYLGDQITPTPTSFQWQTIEPEQGITLRAGVLDHPDPKATVIVIPGFTGSIEMVMREIVTIHAAGYRVASLEYRGQGLSYRPLAHHPEKGYVESYEKLASDLIYFSNQIKREGEQLFFYSISKGAHITMRMAAQKKVDVDAYALIVPMIQINPGDVPYKDLRQLAGIMNTIGLGASYVPGASPWPGPDGGIVFGKATDCNANPATAQTQSAIFAINQKLRTRGVTYKWLQETMRSTDKLLNPEFVADITEPVKIYTAGIDTLVITDAAEQFCESLSNCSNQYFPKARHCITREDYDLYDGILADTIEYFDSQLQNIELIQN